MLQMHDVINNILIYCEVNERYCFHTNLTIISKKTSKRKEESFLVGPGLSGMPLKLYRIARDDE